MELFSVSLRSTVLQVHSYAATERGRGEVNVATFREECAVSFVAFIKVDYIGLFERGVVTVGVIGHDHVRCGRCAVIYV